MLNVTFSVSVDHHCFGYKVVCLQKTPLCNLALFFLIHHMGNPDEFPKRK